jgi:hypothetical protein
MRKRVRAAAGLVVVTGLFVAVTGCMGSSDPRTSNQGGGNIITAGVKIATGEMTALTPDELQILGDLVASQNPAVPTLDDDTAALLADFIDVNNLNSFDDINNLIAQVQADPESIVIPDGFTELFANLSLDDFPI